MSLLAAFGITACDSDDDGDSGGNSLGSGVEADKPAEDLSEAEAKAICEAGGDYAVKKYAFVDRG